MRQALTGIALMAVLIGCGEGSQPAGEPAAADKSADAPPRVELSADAQKLAGIEVQPVITRAMQNSIDVPGVVASTTKGRAVVTPPAPGRVIEINVQLGDVVRAGQRLAVLDSSDLAQSWSSIAEAQRARDAAAAELRETLSEVNLAVAKLNAVRTSLKRQQELAKAGAFSQAPLQQAQSELNDSQSEVLSAQNDLSAHSEQLRRAENLFREGLVSKSDLEAARLEVQQDQIRLDRAQARTAAAKATYERERNISTKGLLNAKELQSAEADVRSADLEKQMAQIRVRSARSALDNANKAIGNAQATYRSNSGGGSASGSRVSLVAPISGTVTRLEVTRGQAVDRTQALLEVENLDSVWVTANVPEKDAANVVKGGRVQVTVAALTGREFRGLVQIIAGRIDPKTRSVPIQCLITGSNGALRPDMFATVHLGVGPSSEALAVPQSAVIAEGKTSFVFVKAEGKFEKREIETGRIDNRFVEIRAGLRAGEVIAVKGEFVLKSESHRDELKGEE